jgi:hypothetical protein
MSTASRASASAFIEPVPPEDLQIRFVTVCGSYS